MALFAVQNLTFTYPEAARPAIDDVSLTVDAGEYVVLCGKSGCGKTTLLRHLKSVLAPHGQRTGNVLFGGIDLPAVSEREQAAGIGFVMQDPDAQVVTDKVWHELAFGLESLGCNQDAMRVRVAEMASYFGIESWFNADVRDLSGGQKQLLNLASIMAMQPQVLVLDEPTSQLDPIAASDFLNTVRKINRELGTAVILSEHRLEEAFPAADRVVVMDAGRVIADADPRSVGAQLHGGRHDMEFALPTPQRVYFACSDAKAGDVAAVPAPLTVREGRAWLSSWVGSAVDAAGKPTLPAPEYTPPERDDCAFELREVWMRYDREAPDVLKGTNLRVPRGRIFALMGGNGTGKSTLLRVMAGVNRPYRGKVLFEGKPLAKYAASELYCGGLALLPQDPLNLFVKKTVRAELEEMLEGGRARAEECAARVADAARLCGIEDLLDAHPYDISGGEQQRAALAKVLVTRPRVLLLDEPTKGIDAFFKRRLAEILRQLTMQGTTIVVVSHDVEFCARYADAVGLLFDGEVVTVNTPRRFFSGNSFYTTAANRMSRHVFEGAVTAEDVIGLCCKKH